MLFIQDSCPRRGRAFVRLALLAAVLLAVIGLAAYLGGRYLWAYHHYREAEQAVARGDFKQAEVHLARCLEVWSTPQTYYEAARVARRAGDYDDAEQYLTQAQKLGWAKPAIDVERTLARVQRGDVRGEDIALLEYVEKNRDKNDPEVPIVLEALSKGYLQSFHLPGALGTLTQWLSLEPRNTQALRWRGGVRWRLRDFKGAEEDYAQAVEIDPELDDARARLAEARLQNGEPKAALDEYSRLHERQPDNPLFLYGLALCRRDLKEPDAARALLDQVLNGHLADVQALKRRPDLGQPHGPEEEWWRQAVEFAPYDLRQPRYIITLFVLALNERAALAATDAEREGYLRRSVALEPYDYASTDQLARCLEKAGSTEAKKYRERADQLKKDNELLAQVKRELLTSPHDPEPRLRAAEIFLRKGQPQEALRWLESAVHEDPNHGPTHDALARYYEQMGDREHAEQERELARRASARTP